MKTFFKSILLAAKVLIVAGASQELGLYAQDDAFLNRYLFGMEKDGYRTAILAASPMEFFAFAQRDIRITGQVREAVNPLGGPPYLVPTNGFLGVISLCDSNNLELPLVNPNLNSTNSYPDKLDWHKMNEPRKDGGWGYWRLRCNNGIFRTPEQTLCQICRVNLRDIYMLTNSGTYKLTIWPKIYKRTETNEDIYQRIDLLPMSTTIHVP